MFSRAGNYPIQYQSAIDSYPMGDMSYDSHFDKYEYEMNRRNASKLSHFIIHSQIIHVLTHFINHSIIHSIS